MSDDVVVNQRALGMLALRVRRIRQALGDDVVAEGDAVRRAAAPLVRRLAGEARAGGRQVLVDGPGHRAMIDDHVVRALRRERIRLAAAALRRVGRARAHANVLQHHVVRRDVDAGANQRDAGRRRGLAGDGEERLGDLDLALREVDDAADFEHDDARAIRFERGQQRARAARRQRRDAQDLAAATAGRVRGRTLRIGKGEQIVLPPRAAGSAAVSSSNREQMDAQSHRRPP